MVWSRRMPTIGNARSNRKGARVHLPGEVRTTHFLRASPRSTALPHYHRRRRPKTNMSFRKSLSKPFKTLGRCITGGCHKEGGKSGREDDREARGAEVGGTEVNQTNSRLRAEVEDAAEKGPGQEGNFSDAKGKKVDPDDLPASPPSIPPGGGSGGTQTTSFFNFCL